MTALLFLKFCSVHFYCYSVCVSVPSLQTIFARILCLTLWISSYSYPILRYTFPDCCPPLHPLLSPALTPLPQLTSSPPIRAGSRLYVRHYGSRPSGEHRHCTHLKRYYRRNEIRQAEWGKPWCILLSVYLPVFTLMFIEFRFGINQETVCWCCNCLTECLLGVWSEWAQCGMS